jgi:hypothetical protein
MSNSKISDSCKLELITESKKVSDYQVNFLIYKNTLENINNKIKKINELILEQNQKIYDKKLEKETKLLKNANCSPTYTNKICLKDCDNFYNPNKYPLKVIGKAIDCNLSPKENFDILGNAINNPKVNNISKKCECKIPKYEEIYLLNKKLENLNLQKTQLMQQYNLANKPPEIPILNLTCCTNTITCENGNCGSLFDDCLINEVETNQTNETFEANITDNNNFFSFKNMSSIILLIILIFLIFLQRK